MLVARGDGMSRPLADVAVGTELPEQVFRVTRADLVRYAGASGDFNPIHWNERVATAVGLPGVIAHGMFTMALAGRAVTAWTGDPGALVEYHVRFGRPGRRPRRRRRRRGDRPRQGRRAARRRPGCASTSPSPAAARRCSPWPARSSAWHDGRGGGSPLAAAAVLLLPGCTSFADTVTAAGPAAGPRRRRARAARAGRCGGLPRRAGRARPRPAAWSAWTSASRTTWRTVTGTETVVFTPDLRRPTSWSSGWSPTAPTRRRPATGWSSTTSAGTTSPAAATRPPGRPTPAGSTSSTLDGRARGGGVHRGRAGLHAHARQRRASTAFGTDDGVSWWASGAPLLAWEPGVGWARGPVRRPRSARPPPARPPTRPSPCRRPRTSPCS